MVTTISLEFSVQTFLFMQLFNNHIQIQYWLNTCVQPIIEQLSFEIYLKMIHANDCFGKANFNSVKSSCGGTAKIQISVNRILHNKWAWTAQATDPGNLPGCLFYSQWNRIANIYASYPARPICSRWSRSVTNGISHRLMLFWRARLSWENSWWGTSTPLLLLLTDS